MQPATRRWRARIHPIVCRRPAARSVVRRASPVRRRSLQIRLDLLLERARGDVAEQRLGPAEAELLDDRADHLAHGGPERASHVQRATLDAGDGGRRDVRLRDVPGVDPVEQPIAAAQPGALPPSSACVT